MTKKKKRLWTIDPQKLQPGDILLERSADIGSITIRFATRGKFSHALLWMGNSDFMEAMPGGIRPMPSSRVITGKPRNWLLLRLRNQPEAAALAAAKVRDHAQKHYSTSGAAMSVIKWGTSRADRTRLFCSQLVALAYEEAGVLLVPGRKPEKTTPADLQRSSALAQVASPFVEILESNHLAEAEGYLDRDKAFKTSQLYTELTASQAAFDAVKAEIAALSKPSHPALPFPPPNLGGLINLLGHDASSEARDCADALLVELDQRGYFDLATPVVVNLSLTVQSMVAELRSSHVDIGRAAAVKAQIDQLVSSWADTEARYRANMAAVSQNYAATHHPLFQRLTKMYSINADAFVYLRSLIP